MERTRGIDWATLTLKDALDLAILVEEEAKRRYQEFVDQLESHRTPEAAGFFRLMVRNEEKHRATLAERRKSLFGDQPTIVDADMIFDVEAPTYDQATAFMRVRAALEVALSAEQKARDFFASALEVVTDAEVRVLFSELREEEIEHEKMVLEQIAKLPPETGPDPASFADDPVAH